MCIETNSGNANPFNKALARFHLHTHTHTYPQDEGNVPFAAYNYMQTRKLA